ncbi:MAG TPA: STAS domain-containing protein [Bryobacteraceae bacterium]|nr:STAS domain-containing protein [Bryobacteraceae bacterium]
MNFGIRQEGERAVVVPNGDVVASGVPELWSAMRDLVRSGSRDMVVDLSETTMIDSVGLGLLLSAFNSLQEKEGAFSVINASEEILELLRSLRMHQHFPVAGK